MLQASRAFAGEARAQNQKDGKQEEEDQQLHGDRVRDRRLRVLRLDVKHPQKRGNRGAQQGIQNFGEPELLGHKAASSCWLLASSLDTKIQAPRVRAANISYAASQAIAPTGRNKPANRPLRLAGKLVRIP